MKNLFFKLTFFCLLLVQLAAAPEQPPLLRSSIPFPDQLSQPFYVKVAILHDQDHFTVSSPFPYTVSSMPSFLMVGRGNVMPDSVIKSVPGGIEIGPKFYSGSHIRLATDQGYFKINKREYRDHLQIIRDGNGKLLVINEVNIENYIKGVLPWEVSPEWSIEALKAQAVVSRTYALFRALDKSNEIYFLEADVLSQVYKGKSLEKARTNEAVDLTRGEVLISGNQIFPAFFHACCGGQTAPADFVWRIQSNGALKGTACPYCIGTKH